MTNIMSNQGTGRCCAAALPVSHSAVRATSPGYRALARCFSSAGGVEAADDVVLMTEAAVKVRLSLSWKVRSWSKLERPSLRRCGTLRLMSRAELLCMVRLSSLGRREYRVSR